MIQMPQHGEKLAHLVISTRLEPMRTLLNFGTSQDNADVYYRRGDFPFHGSM